MIRNIGIALYVLSFLVPPRWRGGADFHLFGGLGAFVQTPVIACQTVLAGPGEGPAHPILFFIIVMASWIANITIYTRMPLVLAVIAILLPWPAYIYLFSIVVGFLPFYPWALGIALIHLSRIDKLWPNQWMQATADGAVSSASRAGSLAGGA